MISSAPWSTSACTRRSDTVDLNDYLKLPYTIQLRQDEDGDWIARIKELEGCTADGATEAEALADLKQAKAEWLSAAIADGVRIPLPEPEEKLPSGKWLQRVPRTVHKALKQLAAVEGISFNQFVASILSNYVGYATGRYATTTTINQTYEIGGVTMLYGQANYTTTIKLGIGTVFPAAAGYVSARPAAPLSGSNFGLGHMRLPHDEFTMMMTGASRG